MKCILLYVCKNCIQADKPKASHIMYRESLWDEFLKQGQHLTVAYYLDQCCAFICACLSAVNFVRHHIGKAVSPCYFVFCREHAYAALGWSQPLHSLIMTSLQP